MSEDFAGTSGRLAGLCGRLFGWRPHEFWECTPAELAAILVPAAEAVTPSLSRPDLVRMMEHEND